MRGEGGWKRDASVSRRRVFDVSFVLFCCLPMTCRLSPVRPSLFSRLSLTVVHFLPFAEEPGSVSCCLSHPSFRSEYICLEGGRHEEPTANVSVFVLSSEHPTDKRQAFDLYARFSPYFVSSSISECLSRSSDQSCVRAVTRSRGSIALPRHCCCCCC